MSEKLLERMVKDLKSGVRVEDVVDKYCTCGNRKLRADLISGIRQIIGKDMIEKAMSL